MITFMIFKYVLDIVVLVFLVYLIYTYKAKILSYLSFSTTPNTWTPSQLQSYMKRKEYPFYLLIKAINKKIKQQAKEGKRRYTGYPCKILKDECIVGIREDTLQKIKEHYTELGYNQVSIKNDNFDRLVVNIEW